MSFSEAAVLLVMGLFAGTYGIIIGAGGGFVMVPLLILAWHFQPSLAVGTSLAVVFVTAVSGTFGYARSRVIDYRTGALLALAEMPGAVLGAIAIKKAPAGLAQIIFGVFFICLATYTALRRSVPAQAATVSASPPRSGTSRRVIVTSTGTRYEYSFRLLPAMAATAVCGVLASFFGIGGGLLRMPLLISIFRFPVPVAAATSIFAMALSTGVGVASHAQLGNIDWSVVVFAGLGVLLGAQLGVKVSELLKQRVVITLLSLALVASGVTLILRGAGIF